MSDEPIGLQEALRWRGRSAVDPAGSKVGTVVEVYLSDEGQEPEWFLVDTGLFGTQSSFVPVMGARPTPDALRLAYAKEIVTEAPRVVPDQDLSADEEAQLYRHYGIAVTDRARDPQLRRAEDPSR